MHSLIDYFYQLFDPKGIKTLIAAGGLLFIIIVVFIENGVFFGFFLPGDTMLFTSGLLCATNVLKVSIYILIITVCISAMLGSIFGYIFGRKMGDGLLRKRDTLLFKKKYIIAAEVFFNKYGGMALIMGRFLPIIRTFAPIFAGIVKLDFKKFISFNIAGAILWVFSMILGGYFLAKIFPNIGENLEYIIISIVIITWIPVVRTYLKERKNIVKKTE